MPLSVDRAAISTLQIIFWFFCMKIICLKVLIPAFLPFTGIRILFTFLNEQLKETGMLHTLNPRMLAMGLLFLGLVFSAGCSAPPGNPADGQRWYLMNNCSSCHGPHGNDGRAVNIAGIDMNFGSFVRKLRTTDAPIMPPFPEEKVSKQDAADIYAYLQSIKPKSNQ